MCRSDLNARFCGDYRKLLSRRDCIYFRHTTYSIYLFLL